MRQYRCVWFALVGCSAIVLSSLSARAAAAAAASASHSGLIIGVGYLSGAGSANSGNLAYWKDFSPSTMTDGSQLATSFGGGSGYIGFEYGKLGVRASYSQEDRAITNGDLQLSNVEDGTVSTDMVVQAYAFDLYFRYPSEVLIPYVGAGVMQVTGTLTQTTTYVSTATNVGSGTLNAVSTPTIGYHAFAGLRCKFGHFGLAAEAQYMAVNLTNFTATKDYLYGSGGYPNFHQGKQVYTVSPTDGKGSPYSANLGGFAGAVYLTLEI